ncbi:PREDICTED: uncharacterized protein LOC106807605 [Priapulus caudatus]|uniref:Uncharacterized protein LOC106807605 n=1 Tax=Priapulus caudatus TaxID=37621 RepID=A0ABM1DZW4_PRICU|nr:PREDICTED: uncharacterized protein LOC106807605 [Priapulus caudatus]
MAGDIPALYAYVNKAFSGSEEDEDIEEATNKRAGSWMHRSGTLEDLNADMEGSWFDMEDRFPDQDSNSDMEEAAALSQTSDIAVVLNKCDSHHRMALYKLTADAEDVVRLFPPGRDADDDAAAAAPVYIIPVKNCGAMNIYRLALQEQLTMTGSAGNLTRGDAMLGSRDFSTLTTGIGSDDAESDDGREMALRRREVAPPVREAVRAAMIAELYADMAAEDGDDSGHETTVERIARGISCQGAPPRRVAYVGRRVSRRESVKRALCVADMLSRSAEDGSARSRELFVVGGGATQCHGKSNKDAWLLNWEKLLGKLTIPEEVLEKLRESCRRRDGEGLSAVSGADMTIGAYF